MSLDLQYIKKDQNVTFSTAKTITLTIIACLLMLSSCCVEDRTDELQQRIANLEQRIASLEPKTPQPEKQARRRKPKPVQQYPAYDEIDSIWWNGRMHSVTYKGQLPVHETTIAPMDDSLDGLMFHPNGCIGFSKGSRNSRGMRISYCRTSGQQDRIVNIKYASRRDREDNPTLTEENGYLECFKGPATFDADGKCYFCLGDCSRNKMYKVISNNPARIEKLYSIDYITSSLQAVPFDPDSLYSTSREGIFRLPKTRQDGDGNGPVWFRINSKKISLSHTLIISPTKLIAMARFTKPPSDGKYNCESKTLLFDSAANAYWTLSIDEIGPMAISWDGKRQIRFDRDEKEIREFQLQIPTD